VFPEIKEKIKKITSDKDGNLWATTGNEGIYFISFPDNHVRNYKITLLGKRNGLESLIEPQAFNVDNEILIGSEKGIYKPEFPDLKGAPDSLIQLKKNPLFGRKTDVSIGQVLKIDQNNYLLKGASIYIATQDGNGYKFDSCGFKRLKDSYQIYLASVGSDKCISFCTDVAYLHYNTAIARDFKKKFNVVIRKVKIGKDSTLFDGAFYSNTDTFKTLSINQSNLFKPTIAYKYNAVTFQFAGLFYEEPEATVYSYKLDGFEKDWSPWSKEIKAVFTNLPEGNYNFKVKAINVYGAEGEVCEYSFVILPPWYREWWAFTIYVILFIVFSSLITYVYTRRLIRQKKFLEGLIKDLKIEMMERKQAEIQLIAMKEKAEESNRLKTAFLAMMNHELRTPLNHILGFSELIMSGVAPEENASFASTIMVSGKSLLSYVEDVFDLALVEQENIRLRYQTFSLMELFIENKVSLDSLLSASEKNDKIRLIFKPDTQWLSTMITTDKNKINKVLNNLFKNAVKFTHEGTIEFGFKMKEGSNLMFYIKDTGIGIPKEKQGIIFDFFRQGDDTTTKAYGGIGIGLAISKKIAYILKGEIKVVSEPDAGSTFSLMVPVEVGGHPGDHNPA
jgi:signal transduction histidine kinase